MNDNASGSFDVYVYLAADQDRSDYTVKDGSGNSVTLNAPSDPTAPSLAPGWYDLGSVNVLAATSALIVSYNSSSGTAPGAVSLLENMSHTLRP